MAAAPPVQPTINEPRVIPTTEVVEEKIAQVSFMDSNYASFNLETEISKQTHLDAEQRGLLKRTFHKHMNTSRYYEGNATNGRNIWSSRTSVQDWCIQPSVS